MDKGSLFIVLFLVIVLIAGLLPLISIHTLNQDFDKIGDCISEWNDTTKEITVEQVFQQKSDEKLANITTEVTFYKGPVGVLDSVSVVNDTHDGKLVVHAKAKLLEKPTRTEFNIHNADMPDAEIIESWTNNFKI